MNLSWVSESLGVGGQIDTADLPRLGSEHRVKHVVDLRAEQSDDALELSAHGLTLLSLPTSDHHAISAPMLDEGVLWVTRRLARGERVYVHCQHGIGRSVLLTSCVLVALGHGPLSSLAMIKRVRPCASPSPAQLEAFRAWLLARECPVPSFQELADVAYGPAACTDTAEVELSP
jgi:protein-tyrosine phosphatase